MKNKREAENDRLENYEIQEHRKLDDTLGAYFRQDDIDEGVISTNVRTVPKIQDEINIRHTCIDVGRECVNVCCLMQREKFSVNSW